LGLYGIYSIMTNATMGVEAGTYRLEEEPPASYVGMMDSDEGEANVIGSVNVSVEDSLNNAFVNELVQNCNQITILQHCIKNWNNNNQSGGHGGRGGCGSCGGCSGHGGRGSGCGGRDGGAT
jgi:uncharacterized membrane protein YgcG